MPKFAINNRGNLIPVNNVSSPSDFESAVYIPDAHIPNIREPIFQLLLQFLKDLQPHKIFILGDWIDSYNVSKYAQDPELFGQLQKELSLGHFYLEQIREVCPKSEGIFLAGNHEARIEKWLWDNPAVASLEVLKVENLLGLKELGFEYIKYGNYYDYNGSLIVKHGDVARMHSAYTAKAEMEKHGVSGISGHTHRQGQFNKTDNSGQKVWQEAGCICEMKLPWADGSNNWQQGFVYSYMEQKGNRFHIVPVPVIRDKFIAGGVFYR